MVENEEPEFRAAMNEFVATVTEAVDISAFAGHGRLAAGTYVVTILGRAQALSSRPGASQHLSRGAPIIRLDFVPERSIGVCCRSR
jgi:hypothetical protein